MIPLEYIWLASALLLILLEVGTPGLFFFVSFAFGALCASGMAFYGFSLYTQCGAALAGTAIAFAAIKYYTSKHKQQKHATNMDALIGQEGVIIEPIESHKAGRVKVGGEGWPAITKDKRSFQKGTVVLIVDVQGNKLVVQ